MTLTTIDTPTLSVGCFLSGPENGPPLLLLHGWPDDARTWDALLPGLHEAGYRTVVPFLRGHGPTRFHDGTTMRSGEIVALTQDALDLAEALGLGRFTIIGHDWGARIAYTAACVAPERVVAIAALSVGWNRNDPDQPISLPQSQAYWYQWLMALDRGAELVRTDRRAFTRHIWEIWNPGWTVPDEAFARLASSFDNPDWPDVTLHSYRVRWNLAPKNSAYAALARHVAANAAIAVPTLMLQGGADPCGLPSGSEGRKALFSSRYDRFVLDGVGHFPQRQRPELVLDHLLPFLAETVPR
jgi:pimeloyl-ACP methyl ester carboxylesterase